MEEDQKILEKISEKITEDKDYLILSWKRLRTKNNEADANLWLRGFLLGIDTLKKIFGDAIYRYAPNGEICGYDKKGFGYHATKLVLLPTNDAILKYMEKYV